MAYRPEDAPLAGVLISADAEWRTVRLLFPDADLCLSPFGQWFVVDVVAGATHVPVLFFHGGWGKIAAAASTQYVIDRWSPRLLMNLGTCGGFEGCVEKGTMILAERTVVYDIIELMGDDDAHISHYTTDLDLSWLGEEYPLDVVRTLLISADRDLGPDDIPRLRERFHAVAADWESGAIAWVCSRNRVRCVVVRGVTDIVGEGGGEAYDGNMDVFLKGADHVIRCLVESLPAWLEKALPEAHHTT